MDKDSEDSYTIKVQFGLLKWQENLTSQNFIDPEVKEEVEMDDQCKEMVWGSSGWRHYRCSRKAKIDGYCKQHHPDTVAERDIKREAAAEAKWQNSPHKKLERAYEKIKRLKCSLKISQEKHRLSIEYNERLQAENKEHIDAFQRLFAERNDLNARVEELEADAETHDAKLTKVARLRLDLESENIRLQARVDALEDAIKDTISNFYTDKPPYYQVHHEVGDMLEQALATTEQESRDE